ncbi:MAG TPA: hypothetical protein VFB16_12350 [Bauldia sp.]|nr:hypothetical protein [Bauldia sp.]
MSFNLPRLALRGIVVAAGLMAGVPAFAADAKQIADALAAASGVQEGVKATYESATASGDDMTITNFSVSKEDEHTVIPSIVFTGAALRDKGGFTAKTMTIGPASVTTRGETIAWQTLTATDPLVPSPDEVKAKAHVSPFSKLDITALTVSGRRFPVPVTIASFSLGVASDAESNPTGFNLALNQMKFPPEFFSKNFLANAYLGMLGYTSGFTVNIGVEGTYENATDTLDLKRFALDISDVGKLTISGKFAGVSLRKLGAMQVKDVQSTGKLDSFSLRFDNAGLVERLIDMQVKTQEIKREDAIQQATAGLSFFLITIQNQAFVDSVMTAATTFLNDPKSITISVQPKQPVPFGTLFDTIGDEPDSLPDLLGTTVTANN